MNYHYLDAKNQPAGPATLEEIRTLAREGKIAADPMVCAVEQSEWKLLSVATKHRTYGGKHLPVSATVLGDLVALAAKRVGGWLSPVLVESSLRWARTIGHYAVLAGAALVLIFALVSAIRTNSFGVFLSGVGYVAALAVAQFTALRFLGTADTLIANTPSRVSSLAFLECVGLLSVLVAIGSLAMGIQMSIHVESVTPLIASILNAVFWVFVGAIALHPDLVAIESGQGSAAEEAIGIVAFFFKAVLKTVPLYFGLLAIVGSFLIVVAIVAPDSRFAYGLSSVLSFLPIRGIGEPGFVGAGAVLAASLLPMAAYFAFLVACLPLELWRSILSIPGKLDGLKK